MTTKSDTGQYSQFLRCFFLYTMILKSEGWNYQVKKFRQNHFFHEMLGLTKVVVTNVSNLDLTFDSRWNTLSPYQASVLSRMLVTMMMMMMEGQDVNAQVAIRIFYIGHRTAFLQRTACMHILLSAGEGNTTGPIDWGMAFHDHLTPEMMRWRVC